MEKAAADSELFRELDAENMAMLEYEIAIGPFEKKFQEMDKLLEEKEKYLQRF